MLVPHTHLYMDLGILTLKIQVIQDMCCSYKHKARDLWQRNGPESKGDLRFHKSLATIIQPCIPPDWLKVTCTIVCMHSNNHSDIATIVLNRENEQNSKETIDDG